MRGRFLALGLALTAVIAVGATATSFSCKNDASCAAKVTAAAPLQATFTVDNVDKACAKRISRAVRGLEGVQDYDCNLAKNALYVAFVPGRTTTETICAAIAKAGYPTTLLSVTNMNGELCDPATCVLRSSAACQGAAKSAGACQSPAKKARSTASKGSTL
jgi:copper chaperone CopZ